MCKQKSFDFRCCIFFSSHIEALKFEYGRFLLGNHFEYDSRKLRTLKHAHTRTPFSCGLFMFDLFFFSLSLSGCCCHFCFFISNRIAPCVAQYENKVIINISREREIWTFPKGVRNQTFHSICTRTHIFKNGIKNKLFFSYKILHFTNSINMTTYHSGFGCACVYFAFIRR